MKKLMRVLTICLAILAATSLAAFAAETKAKGKTKSSKAKKQVRTEEFAPPAEEVPWTLRDKYTYDVGASEIWYAVENSEWRVMVDNVGAVVDNISFRITLADGTVLDPSNLGKADSGPREKFTGELGAGTVYWSEYPAKNGLVVRYNVRTLEIPAILMSVAVGNVGNKPIEIASIEPAITGPAGFTGSGPQFQAGARQMTFRAGCPVYNNNVAAMTLFSDAQNAFTVAIGVLPKGVATSDATFKQSGNAWHGGVSCKYDPSITLAPGEKLESDSVWVSAGVPEPARIDMYYAYANSLSPHPALSKTAPQSWATAPDGAAFADVCAVARDWNGAKVKHALIPWGWEGRPGSYEGAEPNYPGSMAKAADELRKCGVKAGLTVDPLLSGNGGTTSTDGRHWVDLSKQEGRQAALANMKKVVKWGYDFYVVKMSDIPADVLRQFNMTRAQADNLALSVMAEAAGDRSVFPSSLSSAKATTDEWLAVAACTNRMVSYNIQPGPVRLEAESVEEVNEDLITAMQLFNGPIEVTGKASGNAAKLVSKVLGQPRLKQSPLEAATSPKRWQLLDASGQPADSAVLSFPIAK